jgi:nitrilase
MNTFCTAVIQDSPVVFNREATIEKVHFLINQTARQGAKLVGLPEVFVSAYNARLDFGAWIRLRTPKERENLGLSWS